MNTNSQNWLKENGWIVATMICLAALVFASAWPGGSGADANKDRTVSSTVPAQSIKQTSFAFQKEGAITAKKGPVLVDLAQQDENAWQAVTATAGIINYHAYLIEFPAGAHADEAREQIEQLVWFDAVKADMVSSYQRYLVEFPRGKHHAEAQMRFEERTLWDAAIAKDTVRGYRAYLTAFPSGRFRSAAETRLPIARNRQREELPRLASALHGRGVITAPPYHQSPGIHPVVLFSNNGKLHPWHNQLPENWRAEDVAEAELVVLIGEQRETFLSIHHYTGPDGLPAPSITRYRYDLDVRVIAPRTGHVIASRQFESNPRPAYAQEPYHLTRIGSPVTLWTVEEWLRQYVSP